MHRRTRFSSFFNRFEECLQVDCERLKRQLIDQVDQQFGTLHAKVAELRNRFNCGDQVGPPLHINLSFHDDPPVQNVSLEDWLNEQCAAAAEETGQNAPSTSAGHKRKPICQSQSGNKRHKVCSTGGSMEHKCKFTGCSKIFRSDTELVRHEHIHLGIKPYFCTWPDCKYSSQQRPRVVVLHIRSVHFKLPKHVKRQNELKIEDDRDPNEFIRVEQQLANRRL